MPVVLWLVVFALLLIALVAMGKNTTSHTQYEYSFHCFLEPYSDSHFVLGFPGSPSVDSIGRKWICRPLAHADHPLGPDKHYCRLAPYDFGVWRLGSLYGKNQSA